MGLFKIGHVKDMNDSEIEEAMEELENSHVDGDWASA